MIPKMAIDQAITTHREDMSRIRGKVLVSMEAEWRTLDAAYNSANRSCAGKIKEINKDRKNRKDEAYRNYQRDMHTVEGGGFSAYQEDERNINTDCDNQTEQAKTDCAHTCQAAERRYVVKLKEILTKYREDADECIEKLVAGLPSGV